MEETVSAAAWAAADVGEAEADARNGSTMLAMVAAAYVLDLPTDAVTVVGVLVISLALTAIGQTWALNRRIAKEVEPGPKSAEVRTWLGGHVAARNLASGKLDDPSPYAMPGHALALGARYTLDEYGDAFKVLSTWYSNANAALAAVQKRLASKKLKAPPVRCWPHHFDLDTLVDLGRGRTMGIGYCPGDEFCDEPYFYISIYPEPYIPALPLLPPVAHWHSYKFIAALAPAHKIVASLDQRRDIAGFFDISIDAALKALK